MTTDFNFANTFSCNYQTAAELRIFKEASHFDEFHNFTKSVQSYSPIRILSRAADGNKNILRWQWNQDFRHIARKKHKLKRSPWKLSDGNSKIREITMYEL